MNFQKSMVFFSKRIMIHRSLAIANTLGMRKMKNDVKYLSIPLFKSSNRGHDFKHLVEKVNSRIAGWKSKLLSKVGRTCLIQSVGASLPIYVAVSNVIPSKIAKQIDSSLRDFWWGR